MAPRPPAAAARQVVTSTNEARAGSAERTEPPLNPNQPSHSRKTPMVAAGRLLPGEGMMEAREGYAALFAREGLRIDAHDPARCVLFPEMDEEKDVAEITTACWDILGKSPADIMCATSRMVVHRKGEPTPRVVACTLIPYDKEFDFGETLAEACSEAQKLPRCSAVLINCSSPEATLPAVRAVALRTSSFAPRAPSSLPRSSGALTR